MQGRKEENIDVSIVEMHEASVSPDVQTCNAVIKAYSDAGLMEKAFFAHVKMLSVPIDLNCSHASLYIFKLQ